MPYTVTETSKSRLNTFQEARDYAYRQSNSFSSQSQLSVRNPRVYSIRGIKAKENACSLCNSEFHKCLFDFFYKENLD